MKNIAVIGVGGVGGFFGGKLAQINPNLYFIARGNHLKAIRKDGLLLKSKEAGTLVCRPALATDRMENLPMLDICLLCVKEYDLNHTVAELSTRLKPDTIIIPLLNGIDISERIRKITDKGIILPACVYVGTHIESPGVVVQDGGGCKILLGKPSVLSVEQLFSHADIKHEWCDDIQSEIWMKYLFIAAYGLVTASSNKTIGEVYENPKLRFQCENIMKEILAVAKSTGISLPSDAVARSLEKAQNFPYNTKTSFQRDCEARIRDERKLFQDAILNLGQRYEIPLPSIESIRLPYRGSGLSFHKITQFPRGTLLTMLSDAYSFDPRCAESWSNDWKTFDDFFFDNPQIAERYGFISEVNDEPVGFITWDPRHRPEYEEIGHNCILSKYKRHGYGTLQMKEAIRRILLDNPHKIIVTTSALMTPAQKMYERAGFRKTGERPNPHFSGALIDYEYHADIEALALDNQQKACEVIRLSRVCETWESIGAKVNLVGSMAMGLLMKHRDIDFHVYTATLDVATSFKAISQIFADKNITRMEYRNLATTDEACLEWHVWYNLNGEEWQIDMIQILEGSQFDGYFEHVAERIKAVLTPETRRTILELKYLTPENEHIMGIEYYQAVIADGVRTYPGFIQWRSTHPQKGINLWCP